MLARVLPLPVPSRSMALTTDMPSGRTSPKTCQADSEVCQQSERGLHRKRGDARRGRRQGGE